MELFKASNQWATRPADERFWTINEMVDACLHHRRVSRKATVGYADMRVEARDGDLHLMGRAGIPAKLTNWSFGQLSQRAGAPASYLRTLPATLAAQKLYSGLKSRGERLDDTDDSSYAQLLLQRTNGPESMVLRSMNSQRYTRIWNHDVGERLLTLSQRGWITPPAANVNPDDPRARRATDDDCGDFSYVRSGEMIGPSGIYASDHDMFVFLVNPERQIADGSDDGLFRGFFVWNSEVGAASFGVMAFLFKAVCQNHIVWGAQGVHELRVRHVGKADKTDFAKLQVEQTKYADSSASDVEAKIESARRMVLGTDQDSVVDELLGIARKQRIQVSRKALVGAYTTTVAHEQDYGDPNTLWGMVNGLTDRSQDSEFTDDRVKQDQVAGKLLECAF